MGDLKNAKVLITGGTGTFGTAFLRRCLEAGANEIRILSRDERKQYEMRQQYRDYPQVKFYIGDIRDRNTIDPTMYGVDYVFHAAAMKQVPTCEQFPMEAVKTNIIGSNNVLDSAIAHGVKKVVCLSTDKAVYPISAMGMTKAYMEKLALQKAREQDKTAICITRFCNLAVSNGSVVPLFLQQVSENKPITITDPEMTRFIMSVEDAVDLVERAFRYGESGELYIMKAKSTTPAELAAGVLLYLGLETYPMIITGARPGEKKHEALLTEAEAATAVSWEGCLIVPANGVKGAGLSTQYHSDKAERMPLDEIVKMIREVYA